MKLWKRQYVIEMVLAFGGYALGLFLYNFLDEKLHHSPWKLISLVPLLVSLNWIIFVILRAIYKLDEMWRKIILEGMSFAGIVTAFTCFTFLFFDDLGFKAHAEWGFYIYWAYFTLGTSWARWRILEK